MSVIRGTFREFHQALRDARKMLDETCERTGIYEALMGGPKKMNLLASIQNQGYLYNQMLHENPHLLGNAGIGGIEGGQYLNQNTPNPYINNPQRDIYPGMAIEHEQPGRYGYLREDIVSKYAEQNGFIYDFETGGFVNRQYNSWVHRRQIENANGPEAIKKLFELSRIPNISWLDKRIDEMRVKLI